MLFGKDYSPICLRCGADNPQSKKGRSRGPLCKPCVTIECNRKFYAANREEQRARAAQWKADNPGKVKATSAVWCVANKDRRATNHKRWREADPERTKQRRRDNYAAAKERENATSRAYKAAHADDLREKNAAYLRANPELNRFHRSQRRSREAMATPPWADPKKIRAIYAAGVATSAATGVPHEVDHIVPLKSELVCGLHCEANLQVISSTQNRSKRNRHWLHMPTQ